MNNREKRKARQAERAAKVAAIDRTVPNPSQTQEEADSRLADFAHRARQLDEQRRRERRDASNRRMTSTGKLPPMPRLPRERKPKAGRPCACGCADETRGGRFLPGHDARLYGWARRVERGVVALDDVPAPHTEAVRELLARQTAGSDKKAHG